MGVIRSVQGHSKLRLDGFPSSMFHCLLLHFHDQGNSSVYASFLDELVGIREASRMDADGAVEQPSSRCSEGRRPARGAEHDTERVREIVQNDPDTRPDARNYKTDPDK